MERNSLIEESLARAFQLAYFIHGDRETALNIAAEALAKLEVAAAAQDKRLYYTPTGRAERGERFRTKVSIGETHLLQRLVYVESEPYERRAEQASNGESPEEEDMLIYFIKHLVRITVRRNSFYVTLGLSRMLAIKKVHVDPFVDDSVGKQFRDQLTAALRANRRFSLTTNRDEADAVLKGRMTATRPEQASATIRLVNARGEVVWPIKGPVSGKHYQGSIATIAGQIARDLLADIDKAEHK